MFPLDVRGEQIIKGNEIVTIEKTLAKEIRPIGYLRTTREGKSHIPALIRREIGIQGEDKIAFFLNANCVLLIRKGASLGDVLQGLDVLKQDLELRWSVEAKSRAHEFNEKFKEVAEG
jgi:bifunctional DNA-binding transcriptional regulator/antitoxin component of YhaV-PrlF toxin-antitoxin module